MDANVIERKWIQGTTVKPDPLTGQTFTGESGAHTFRITGETTGGATAAITGTISGQFLRSDNVTVALTGTLSSGVAAVTLTSECYAVPGRFIISIYSTEGGVDMCIYCGIGNVFRTSSDQIAYPSASLPDLQALTEQVQAAIASCPASHSAIQAAVAPTFAQATANPAGTYVWYDGSCYYLPNGHTANASWADTTKSAAVIGNDVADLKSAVKSVGVITGGTFKNGDVIFTSDDIPPNTPFSYDFTTSDSGVQYIRFKTTGGSYIRNIGKTSSGGTQTFKGTNDTPYNFIQCEAYCNSDTTITMRSVTVNSYASDFSSKEETRTALNNLYDGVETVPYDKIYNKGFNTSTGAFPDENNWVITSFIPVIPGEKLTISNPNASTQYNGFYASDKSFLESFNVAKSTENVKTVPDNAYYMVLSNSTANFDFSVTRKVKNLVTEDEIITASRNLFNQAFVRGRINSDTGETILNPTGGAFAIVDPIPVTPGTQYTFSYDKVSVESNRYMFGFAQDGSYSGTISSSIIQYSTYLQSETFTVPNGIYGIKWQIGDNRDTYTDNIRTHVQLEAGGVQTPYVSPDCVQPAKTDAFEAYKILTKNSLFPDFHDLPDYYFANNYLPAKCDTINSYMDSSVANGDAFVFITDEHWEENAKRSPAMLKYIFDNTTVNKLISGGDIYDGNHNYDFPTAREFMLKLRHGFPGKIWPCVGNHDLFKGMPSSRLSALFDMYHDDYNGDPDKHYYYVDNKRAKIRYIVLADYYAGANDNVQNGFIADTVQQTWFRDVALNLDTGWGAVIVTHQCWYNGATMADLAFDSRYKKPLIDVVNNYSGNGEIICIIQGHTHVDRILHTGTNNTGIPVIITTCDKYKPVETPPDIYPADREPGTIREQAFDVVIINRTNRTIYAVRCGCEAYDGTTDSAYGDPVQVRTVTY